MNKIKFKISLLHNTEIESKTQDISQFEAFERNFNYFSNLYNIDTEEYEEYLMFFIEEKLNEVNNNGIVSINNQLIRLLCGEKDDAHFLKICTIYDVNIIYDVVKNIPEYTGDIQRMSNNIIISRMTDNIMSKEKNDKEQHEKDKLENIEGDD